MRTLFLLTFIFIQYSITSEAERFYKKTLEELSTISINKNRCAEVVNFSFKKDVAEFTLQEGSLYFLSPIGGRICGALFVGNGTMSFTPPTDIERKQLYRYIENESFHGEFRSLFILFNDSTLRTLENSLTFAPTDKKDSHKDLLEKSLRFIKNYYETEYHRDIMNQLLHPIENDFFYAHFITKKNISYFFEIDPTNDEEVSFQHNDTKAYVTSSGSSRQLVSSFHRETEYHTTQFPEHNNSTLSITSYKMETNIDDNLSATARCTITASFLPSKNKQWIPFSLFSDLIVDSVFINTKKAFFSKMEKSSLVWVSCPDTIVDTSPISIVFYYRGNIFSTAGYWKYLKTLSWYPQPYEELKSTFDMTFHFPATYTLVGAGDNISHSVENNIATSHWQVKTPHTYTGFALGKYDERTILAPDIPTIKYFLSKEYAHFGSLHGNQAEKELSHDLENSYRFFTELFGALDNKQLYVAEIPNDHGIAFPGMLHLSWITFNNKLDKKLWFDSFFRAHEVSHQWWGFGVEPASYHDAWLSEGFASYCGLWYTQAVSKNKELFFDALLEYRKQILSNRKYLFASGQEAGPVWLGYRTNSERTENDYNLIIYKKGAWILHMLRNMSIDLKTMNEDIFKRTLREFFQTYKGTFATTRDFQKIVEKNFGVPMDWFFKQWVYNVEIPKYHIIYKLQELENGKFKVRCTVKQSNVPEDFQMYVPFLVDFGEGRIARVKYLIKGPITEFDFPVLPVKPKQIKFNDLESVLCEIDDEDWD